MDASVLLGSRREDETPGPSVPEWSVHPMCPGAFRCDAHDRCAPRPCLVGRGTPSAPLTMLISTAPLSLRHPRCSQLEVSAPAQSSFWTDCLSDGGFRHKWPHVRDTSTACGLVGTSQLTSHLMHEDKQS